MSLIFVLVIFSTVHKAVVPMTPVNVTTTKASSGQIVRRRVR